MKLPQLQNDLTATFAEMRAIQQAADAANRDLETREEERYAALETKVEDLKKKIARAKVLDNIDRQANAEPVEPSRDSFEVEARRVELFDAIAAQSDIDRGTDLGRVREVSQEIARRMGKKPQGIYVPQSIFERRVVQGASSGAGVIPTDHRPDLIIDTLDASSILQPLGATFLNNLQGNLSIPAIDTGGTVEWFADSGSITGADMDINSRSATPHFAACLTEFSRSMVIQADPSVNAMGTRNFGRKLTSALDGVALVGGVGAQPSGVFDTITPGSCATPTYAQVLALIEAINVANAAGASMGFVLHPKTVTKLRSTLVAASTDSRMIMEGPNQLLGYQAQVSTNMPLTGSPATGSILFGDWSSLVVCTWGPGIDILANPYESDSFRRGGIAVRGILSCDVVLRHEESFAGALDVAL